MAAQNRRQQAFKVPTTSSPMPPSLAHSPYLSPTSMFRTEYVPRQPGSTQEAWLMDTIPAQQRQGQAAGQAQASAGQGAAQSSQQTGSKPAKT